MKTYEVIERRISRKYNMAAIAGNNEAWDLVLKDESGRLFSSEAFMCVGGVPDFLTEPSQIHPSQIKPHIAE